MNKAISKATPSNIRITKSTRHQKIIGQFGEHLICNWLSRSGFEVAIVDHTGIDIIAFHSPKNVRLGITVKSRTRNVGTEKTDVTVFKKDDVQKLERACKSFSCQPWIAVYVETTDSADIYLTNLENYRRKYWNPNSSQGGWQMSDKYRQRYLQDENIMNLHIDFHLKRWWYS